jgi:hypothetical protein
MGDEYTADELNLAIPNANQSYFDPLKPNGECDFYDNIEKYRRKNSDYETGLTRDERYILNKINSDRIQKMEITNLKPKPTKSVEGEK